MIVRRTGDWLAAKVGDDLVMMSARTGKYLGLTPVGARIWELIEQPRALDDICTQLTNEYDVTAAQARDEVEAFLKELAGNGAVAFDNPQMA